MTRALPIAALIALAALAPSGEPIPVSPPNDPDDLLSDEQRAMFAALRAPRPKPVHDPEFAERQARKREDRLARRAARNLRAKEKGGIK